MESGKKSTVSDAQSRIASRVNGNRELIMFKRGGSIGPWVARGTSNGYVIRRVITPRLISLASKFQNQAH
jgi:hypothetical protein